MTVHDDAGEALRRLHAAPAHAASLGNGWFAVVCFLHWDDAGAPASWCDPAGPLTASEAMASALKHNAEPHEL